MNIDYYLSEIDRISDEYRKEFKVVDFTKTYQKSVDIADKYNRHVIKEKLKEHVELYGILDMSEHMDAVDAGLRLFYTEARVADQLYKSQIKDMSNGLEIDSTLDIKLIEE